MDVTARETDAAVEAVARRQFGAFNLAQAMQAGATDRLVRARVHSGRWTQLDAAVFAIAGAPDIWERRLTSAHLGETGHVAVSFASAAAVHGMFGFRPGPVELTVVHHKNHRSGLTIVHESRDLEPTDIVDVGGIPTTSPEFTILQLATRIGRKRLARTVDDALASHTLHMDRLNERFDRYARRGLRGIGHLRAVLEERGPGYEPPASALEAELIEVIEWGSLPTPVRQFRFPWRTEVEGRSDLAYPPARLLIEADSRRWHTRVNDFATDRRRDREAAEHGHRVVRFVWEEVMRQRAEVVRSIRACLAVAA